MFRLKILSLFLILVLIIQLIIQGAVLAEDKTEDKIKKKNKNKSTNTSGHVLGYGLLSLTQYFKCSIRYEPYFTHIRGYFWYADKDENFRLDSESIDKLEIEEGVISRAFVSGPCKVNNVAGYIFELEIVDMDKIDTFKLEVFKANNKNNIIYKVDNRLINGNVRVHRVCPVYNGSRRGAFME